MYDRLGAVAPFSMSEQQATPKQSLVILVQSLIKAHLSEDDVLKQLSANAFSEFLSKHDLTPIEAEAEEPPAEKPKQAKSTKS